MAPKAPPEQAAKQFFYAMMQNQCQVAWRTFSGKSQDHFLKWTLDYLYRKHQQAAEFAQIGVKEVRILFENNDSSLMKSFWRRFYHYSNAGELFRFGYFSAKSVQGNKATVEVLMKFPDGRTKTQELPMVLEKNTWRIAYVEGELPF